MGRVSLEWRAPHDWHVKTLSLDWRTRMLHSLHWIVSSTFGVLATLGRWRSCGGVENGGLHNTKYNVIKSQVILYRHYLARNFHVPS